MEEKNHIYPIFDRMMTRQDNRTQVIPAAVCMLPVIP